MLGSDPILQYYHGLGKESQGVITLEPVYTGFNAGGGVKEWIDRYLPAMAQSESITFNYIQAGQENFPVTPATAVTVPNDYLNGGKSAVLGRSSTLHTKVIILCLGVILLDPCAH